MGSRTLAGAKLSAWEGQMASGWVGPSAEPGAEGTIAGRREAWVFSSHPLTPFPLQGPEASDQDSVSASSEWQRKLEAAEALLMLRNSSQASSGSISLLQPCVAAGSLVLERRAQHGVGMVGKWEGAVVSRAYLGGLGWWVEPPWSWGTQAPQPDVGDGR